jgi:outer membrane receptor for ferrienterochelin and colicin
MTQPGTRGSGKRRNGTHERVKSSLLGRALRLGAAVAIAHATLAHADSDADSSVASSGLAEVTVTASRLNLLGTADTASQGSVTQEELDLRPAYRVGQLLESVPGLVVTVHSGEGKANQYLARGFNLDHGTDIANFVDDMPINRPTNAHGQGYSDLNFLMPEFMSGRHGAARRSGSGRRRALLRPRRWTVDSPG